MCIVRFFFPGVLVGPYLDYAEYRALVDESVFAAHAGNGRTKPGRAIPAGRKRVAYAKMGLGLGFLGLFVVFGGSCHFGVALTPWFVSKGWAYRCVCLPPPLVVVYPDFDRFRGGPGLRFIRCVGSWSGASIMRFGR